MPEQPATLVGATLASQLAVVLLLERGEPDASAMLAIAAGAWVVAELAKSPATPTIAFVPAMLATVLEPGCAALVALSGARMLTTRHAGLRADRRWGLAVIIVGMVGLALAVWAGTGRQGWRAGLGHGWFGEVANPFMLGACLRAHGEALGPLVALAALAGIVAAMRGTLAAAAIVTLIAGGLLVDLRAGTTGPLLLGMAALGAGIAVARLAGMVRLARGQAILAGGMAFMLLFPAAWIAMAVASR